MRVKCWVGLTLLLCLAAGRMSNAVEPPPPGTVLFGKVVDAAGKPVGGATVYAAFNFYILDIRELTATTEADGTFRLPKLPEGPDVPIGLVCNAVYAMKSGHALGFVRPEASGVGKPLTIALRTPSPLEIRVLDPSGQPLPDLTVRAYGGDWGEFIKGGTKGQFVLKTDATGAVTIDWFPVGVDATVYINDERKFEKEPVDAGGRLIFADHELSVAFAKSGQNKPIEVRLKRAARIEGRIAVKSPDSSSQGYEVMCERVDKSRSFSGAAVSDDEGKFAIDGLEPGDFKLTVHDTTYPPRGFAQDFRITGLKEGEVLKGTDLTVTAGVLISGKIVHAKSGKGLAHVELGCWLNEMGDKYDDYEGVTTDDDGAFTIRLKPGKWTLSPITEEDDDSDTIVRTFEDGEIVKGLILKRVDQPPPKKKP